jgi:hypothetical protein
VYKSQSPGRPGRLGFYMVATNFFQHNYSSVLPFYTTRLRKCVRCNVEARSRYHCCLGKTINVTYSVCVCILALVMQHANRMHRIILSSVACPAVPYFSTLSRKLNDFRQKRYAEHKMCVLIFSTNFRQKHFSVWEELSEI